MSLARLAKRYGLPEKMDTLRPTKGINFEALKNEPGLHQETWRSTPWTTPLSMQFLYNVMLEDGFPQRELEVIDWVVKMVALPQFELDELLVAEHLGEVLAHKEQLLAAAQLTNRDNLMRDDALAGLLILLGVDPVPRKISTTTGQEQWAFAKTDRDFTMLLEHPDPRCRRWSPLGSATSRRWSRAGRSGSPPSPMSARRSRCR